MVKVSVLGDWIYGIECHPKHRKTAVNKKIFSRSTVEIRFGFDYSTIQHANIPNHYPNLLFDISTGTYFVIVILDGAVSQRCRPMMYSLLSFPIKFKSYGRRNVINITPLCRLTKTAVREHTAGVKPLSNGICSSKKGATRPRNSV